ncbi:hypothetical protein SAMN05421545_3130 [Pontibacter lucknowensis]|uniref:Uncharacterized protein n=1 Tax=Pontibacter lucknowensis TaxID=1077936 RepID=A0A1N6ZZV3_9BACT|nr:hypothetical protein SAMN05421545_3130 [Pontibacter lucknowensis]
MKKAVSIILTSSVCNIMNLYEFNLKPLPERISAVWEHGSFLAIRSEASYSIVLYHMGKFFAEVWYNPYNNQIERTRSFKSKNCLEPYLNLIDLSELLRK